MVALPLWLGVECLKSMTKLISYYRSNAHSEFGFYGKGTKKGSIKLNNNEISAIVMIMKSLKNTRAKYN